MHKKNKKSKMPQTSSESIGDENETEGITDEINQLRLGDPSPVTHILEKLKSNFSKNFKKSGGEYISTLYIKPQGRSMLDGEDLIEVWERIEQFLKAPSKRTLLVLGDAGLGKSLLAQQWVAYAWQNYDNFKFIPVLINLSDILYLNGSFKEKRSFNLLKTYLTKKEKLDKKECELLLKEQLLMVLDSYDEVIAMGKLCLSEDYSNIKAIITCRLEVLIQDQNNNDYQEYFRPYATFEYTGNEQLVELFLNPFSDEQINEYLKNYIDKAPKTGPDIKWEDYKTAIHEVGGLLELVRNPFMLDRVAKNLTLLLVKACKKNKIPLQSLPFIRFKLYKRLIEDWFERQVDRLNKIGNLKSFIKGEVITPLLRTYSENLAYIALQRGCLGSTFEEDITLKPELLQSTNSGRNFYERLSSLEPETKVQVLKHIRSSCLLKTGKDCFSFWDGVVAEYFAAKKLYEDVIALQRYRSKKKTWPEEAFTLALQSLNAMPGVVQMLAELAKNDETFKKHLQDMVKFFNESTEPNIAALNATAILKWEASPSHTHFTQVNISEQVYYQWENKNKNAPLHLPLSHLTTDISIQAKISKSSQNKSNQLFARNTKGAPFLPSSDNQTRRQDSVHHNANIHGKISQAKVRMANVNNLPAEVPYLQQAFEFALKATEKPIIINQNIYPGASVGNLRNSIGNLDFNERIKSDSSSTSTNILSQFDLSSPKDSSINVRLFCINATKYHDNLKEEENEHVVEMRDELKGLLNAYKQNIKNVSKTERNEIRSKIKEIEEVKTAICKPN